MGRYRYPGPRPFTDKDKSFFFGRDDEKDLLNSTIRLNKLTVVFGRSGYGKSSLIQAGILPYFQSEEIEFKTIEVRFTKSDNRESEESTVKAQLFRQIKKLTNGPVFLNEIHSDHVTDGEDVSLWQIFKTLQWETRREGRKGVLLVMDQFEEIFNFSKWQYYSALSELSDIIYNRMPASFQDPFLEKIESDATFAEVNHEQIDFIRNEIPTNFLIGIRSDRLYLLDELADLIPTIFNNRFDLKPISDSNINKIIQEPCQTKPFDPEGYLSREYKIEDSVVNKIKKHFYSTTELINGFGQIEASQIQIICQYIERKVIDRYNLDPELETQIIVDEAFFFEEIDDVIQSYYVGIINDIHKQGEKGKIDSLIARFVIERKLIDQRINCRVCIDKSALTSLGINDKILDHLLGEKLIRKELNTVSGQSFELSHDTLIEPICKASRRDLLGSLDEELTNYYRHVINDKSVKNIKNIEKKFLDEKGNITPINFNSGSKITRDTLESLVKYKLLNHLNGNFILNEIFLNTVALRIRKDQKSKLKSVSSGFIGALLLLFLAGFLLSKALHLSIHENAMRVGNQIRVTDTINEDAINNLLRLSTVHKKLRDLPEKSKQIDENLVEQFNNLYLYGFIDSLKGMKLLESRVSVNERYFLANYTKRVVNDYQPMNVPPKITAVLYDSNNKRKAFYKKLDNALFLDNSDDLITIKDSILTINPQGKSPRKVTMKFDSIDKDLIKIPANNPYDIISDNKAIIPVRFTSSKYLLCFFKSFFNQFYVILNIESGQMKRLTENPSALVFQTEHSANIFIYDFLNKKDGTYEKKATLLLKSSDGKQVLKRLRLSDDVYFVNPVGTVKNFYTYFNSPKDRSTTICRWDLNFRLINKQTVSTAYGVSLNERGFLTVASVNRCQILQPNLVKVKSINENSLNLNVFSSSKDTLILFKAESLNQEKMDSVILKLFIGNNERPVTKKIEGIVQDVWFSKSGDTIFCPTLAKGRAHIYLLNHKLEKISQINIPVTQLFGVSSFHIKQSNVITFNSQGKLVAINLRSNKLRFNNTKLNEIDGWITTWRISPKKKDTPELLSDNILVQLANLFLNNH